MFEAGIGEDRRKELAGQLREVAGPMELAADALEAGDEAGAVVYLMEAMERLDAFTKTNNQHRSRHRR